MPQNFVETVVAKQLQNYLFSNDLFPVLRSAYRPKHSIETALLKVIKRWFVFEALGPEECLVTLRMLISTSKLLKEPLNRTIDVFPYFIYIFLFHYYYYYFFFFVFLAVERNF